MDQEDLTLDEHNLLWKFKNLHPALSPRVLIEPWARGCYRAHFADELALHVFNAWAQARGCA